MRRNIKTLFKFFLLSAITVVFTVLLLKIFKIDKNAAGRWSSRKNSDGGPLPAEFEVSTRFHYYRVYFIYYQVMCKNIIYDNSFIIIKAFRK